MALWSGSGKNCAIEGCHNSSQKLAKWKESFCDIHAMPKKDCACLFPYRLHSFPKDNNIRRQWVEAVNRKGFEPKPHSRVCSFHFVDGKPTDRNPVPQLDLGYETKSVAKELKSLSFANPGKFMDNFDPERSAREMRKMNRRIYRENIRKNQVYDEVGLYLENSSDICDCLNLKCPGCHFPCSKCGSEKCGQECRCCRRYIFESIEIEGTKTVIKFPDEIKPSFT